MTESTNFELGINGEFNFEGPSKVTLVGLNNKTQEFLYFQEHPTFFDNKPLDLFTPPSFNAYLSKFSMIINFRS